MTEISTVAVITAKPGSGPEVEAALRTLAAASHQEPECLLYSLQRGLADPNVFVTVEKWASQAGLDAHLASAHIATAMGTAGSMLVEPPRIIAAEWLDAGDPAKREY